MPASRTDQFAGCAMVHCSEPSFSPFFRTQHQENSLQKCRKSLLDEKIERKDTSSGFSRENPFFSDFVKKFASARGSRVHLRKNRISVWDLLHVIRFDLWLSPRAEKKIPCFSLENANHSSFSPSCKTDFARLCTDGAEKKLTKNLAPAKSVQHDLFLTMVLFPGD